MLRNIFFMFIIILSTTGCIMTKPFMINKSGESIYLCKGNIGWPVQNNTRFGGALTKEEHSQVLYLVHQEYLLSQEYIDCRYIDSSNAKKIGEIGTLIKQLARQKNEHTSYPIYVLNKDRTITIKSFNPDTNEVSDNK